MNHFDSNFFYYLIVTGFIWQAVLGAVFQVVYNKSPKQFWNFASNTFFYLAILFFFLDMYLLRYNINGWNQLFHQDKAFLFWIPTFISPALLFYLNARTTPEKRSYAWGWIICLFIVSFFLTYVTVEILNIIDKGLIQPLAELGTKVIFKQPQ